MDTPPPSRPKRHYIRIVLTAIVMLILAIILAYFFTGPIERLPITLENYFTSVPSDAVGLAVLTSGPFGQVSVLGTHGLTQVSVPSGSRVVDYATSGGIQYAITIFLKDRTNDIENLTTHTALTTDGKPKSALAVSPDGVWLAYSVLASTTLTIPATASGSQPMTIPITYSSDLGAWVVKAINTKTGTVLTLGTGYGPQFFGTTSPDTVLFSSAGQLNTYDLSTGTLTSIPWQTMTNVSTAAHLSDDGSELFSYSLATGVTNVFTLENADLRWLGYAGSLPQGVSSVVGRGGLLYGLEQEGSATMLWKGDSTGKGTAIYTFKSTVPLSVLLP